VQSLAEAAPLLSLARSRDPGDRERLLARLVDICEANAGAMAPGAASEVEACSWRWSARPERDIRARLAERLARADWAPRGA